MTKTLEITLISLSVLTGGTEMAFVIVYSFVGVFVNLLSKLRIRLHENYDYREWLKEDLADCDTILELGCGSNSPLLSIGYGSKTVAVDIYQPYINNHNQCHDYQMCYQADILNMQLPLKTFDAVVMTDVLEHLDKSAVFSSNLFNKIENCAKKKIILFTPNGYRENKDVDGNIYQHHKSSWSQDDFQPMGYSVHGATGLKFIFGDGSLAHRPRMIMEILGMLSQRMVFNNPKLAYHTYAVKVIK